MLEGLGFHNVKCLADVALTVEGKAVAKEGWDFEHLRQLVLRILLRVGPDPESQDRRKILDKELRSSGDEPAETLETLSIEQKIVGTKLERIFCDARRDQEGE